MAKLTSFYRFFDIIVPIVDDCVSASFDVNQSEYHKSKRPGHFLLSKITSKLDKIIKRITRLLSESGSQNHRRPKLTSRESQR